MDKKGFRSNLQARQQNEEQIEAAIALAERFETFIEGTGRAPTAETAWAFSRLLIEEGYNTEENYIALIRYCAFIKNNAMFVALLELVDGGEVSENLYRMTEERFGKQVRDEIFAGIGIAPYGIPSPEKPAYLQPVIERLVDRVGEEACQEFLSTCLRDLPDQYYLDEPSKYHQAGDIDTYLLQRKAAFLTNLEACLREERLFFAQEITEEVLEFVRNDPEMGGGRREGNTIYETKIPYMTRQYLAETDRTMKRFYACHCPWAREAIRKGDVRLAEVFCNCSGGFHKKPLEVVFAQPLKVEVLESVLKGDDRCRFAIHLPTQG